MGSFDDLPPEEREKVKKLRDRGFQFLQKICLAQLGLAGISVITGIVLVAIAAENPTFPYIIASPIWSGILVAIGAVCGFQASRQGIHKDDVEDKIKAFVICHYVFNLLCITVCLGSGVISVLGIIFCQSTDQKVLVNCEVNHDALLALSIISAIVGVFLALCCIVGTCYFGFYARSLGFKGRYDRRYDRRIQEYRRDVIVNFSTAPCQETPRLYTMTAEWDDLERYDRRIQHMQNEINQLRAAQAAAAPPPYSEDESQGRFNYGIGKISLVDLSRR